MVSGLVVAHCQTQTQKPKLKTLVGAQEKNMEAWKCSEYVPEQIKKLMSKAKACRPIL